MKLHAGILLSIMSVSLGVAPLFAQPRTETTAEQEYLNSVEYIVISELAASTDRDSKNLALDYAEENVKSGNVQNAIRQTIIDLGGEGTLSVSTMNGRVTNNFPDIRRRACELLGEIPSVESKEALKKIAYGDNEPMVVTAALRSLGAIGGNDDVVVDTVIYVQKRFALLNPSSSLADAALEAYSKLASGVTDPLMRSSMIQSIGEIAINYNYVKPVRDKALALLKTLKQ